MEALRDAPPGWRRLIFVLSDGNSAFGRNYELVQGSAAQARVAVFAVGTPDSNNPFRFLERMGQETGGQAWIFEKAQLQPSAGSPVLLDILVDQAVKAIKSAYRLEYTPPSAREQRELSVGVRMASGDARSRLVSYRADPAPSVPQPLLFLGIGLPLLALAGGGLYYYWLRPVKTDYYLAGYGPSTGHVPELYLYTDWRPLGRGGRGYPLTPDDPFFAGISKTHVWLRVQNWRRHPGGQRPGAGSGGGRGPRRAPQQRGGAQHHLRAQRADRAARPEREALPAPDGGRPDPAVRGPHRRGPQRDAGRGLPPPGLRGRDGGGAAPVGPGRGALRSG